MSVLRAGTIWRDRGCSGRIGGPARGDATAHDARDGEGEVHSEVCRLCDGGAMGPYNTPGPGGADQDPAGGFVQPGGRVAMQPGDRRGAVSGGFANSNVTCHYNRRYA